MMSTPKETSALGPLAFQPDDGSVEQTSVCDSGIISLSSAYNGEDRAENEETDSLPSFACNDSLESFSVIKNDVDGLVHDGLHTFDIEAIRSNDQPSRTAMSLGTDVLSGIESKVLESVAMLTLDSFEMLRSCQDEDEVSKEQDQQQGEAPSVRCIHEGSLISVYCLGDPMNKFGGKTNAVAIKVLTEQFPDPSQMTRLKNERNMSSRLSEKCAAVRAALNSPSSDMGMPGMEDNSSRLIYLEWLPGLSLKEWVRTREEQLNAKVSCDASICDHEEVRKSRHKSSINMAWKIALALSEIHEVGGVVLNNISSDNIIANKTSKLDDDYTVHVIGLGSASLLSEAQNNNSGIRNDLRALGGVLFELFSGQAPHQTHCSRNERSTLDEKIDDSDRREIYRPVRELRSILSMSFVSTRISAFILELMGSFESSVPTVPDHYYKSVREVSDQLQKMILEPEACLPSPANQESSKALGWLNFAPNCLRGREEQQIALRSAYERVILKGGACEVVLVSGFSGAGKTAFVEQTLRGPIMDRGGHFLHVKFDQHYQAKPLAAIITAFADFCDNISNVNTDYLSQLVTSMETVSGVKGLAILAELIPTLGRIINSRIKTQNISTRGLHAENRLTFVFQALVRAITGPESPMILFLDDLQWADDTSLNLLRALIMDSEKGSMLFVDSYRENEVTLDHPFSRHISDLKVTVGLTEIQIGNLKMNEVNGLLSDAICEPPHTTEGLSSIVYRKTGGNVLLAIQFVKYLWDEGLLWYSFYGKNWQWNTKLIESNRVLNDAADLIAQKISSFPSDLQFVLKKMACLGSQCEKSTLSLLGSRGVDDRIQCTIETSAMSHIVSIAIQEGIIDVVGSRYKFAHDQIQLAAYLLIPEDERSAWHLEIGRQMIRLCGEKEIDDMLYTVVDQLNRGKKSLKSEDRCIELAELNYRAGDRARSSGMFATAALYFEEGINLLDSSHWNNHYKLWLRLHTSSAESEFRNGNFENMSKALDLVITHGRCFDDQLLAYRILVFSLGAQKKMKEAIQMGIGVLDGAGEQFPADPDVSIVQAEFLKTKQMLAGKTIDTLMTKIMHDKQKMTLMEILESLVLYSFYANDIYLPLFICRMIQLSICHGVCPNTITGLGNFSMVMCGKLGDVKGGNEHGKLAVSIMERMNAWNKCCRVYAPLYGFVFPRTEHLHSCVDPLLRAHHECVKTGDTEFAIVNAALYVTILFQGGKNLSQIKDCWAVFERKVMEYKQELPWQIVLPLKQLILNLMGQAENLVLLEGEAISFKKHFSTAEEKKNIQVSCRLYLYQMQLAYMFNELELAAQMSGKCREIESILLGKYECCHLIFYESLIAFDKARKSGSENMWIILAQENTKKMKKWAEDSPSNCEHKLQLLEAEEYFLIGSYSKAVEKIESAILSSGKNGFIQDQALSHERASAYYLESGDEVTASYHYGKAHDLYLEWGANGKADHLCRHSPF